MSRLRELYDNEITKKMTEKFGYKNPMMVPKIDKIVINMGVGEAKENSKLLDAAVKELETIGCKVTLRGEKMYEFLDRLVNLALPRVRDFRGVSADSFDGRGNYALGIKEQIIFPEIEYDKIDKVRGMDVIIATTAHTDEEARELLRMFNMPFKN